MAIAAWYRHRWVKYGLEALFFLVLFLAVAAWQKRDLAEGPAPALAGRTLDGADFVLHAPRGEPLLVHFWASWCPVCKVEEGAIDGLVSDEAHTVITVAMASGDAVEVRRHLQQRGLKWPVLVDQDGALAAAWGVRGVPATFVIDSDGRIRFREMGYTSGPGLRLRLWWAGMQ
jgi:peroxiredoxin